MSPEEIEIRRQAFVDGGRAALEIVRRRVENGPATVNRGGMLVLLLACDVAVASAVNVDALEGEWGQ